MNDLLEEMSEAVGNDQTVAVATIVRTKGSTPREVGARMLIEPDGRSRGTVGGGCGEADVWAEAMTVLTTGVPRLVEIDLLHDQDPEGGRACGGLMYVFIERLPSSLMKSPSSCENDDKALTETSRP